MLRSIRALPVLAISLVLCALEGPQKPDIFREDEAATVLASAPLPGFVFDSERDTLIRCVDGVDQLELTGMKLVVRGPAPVIGAAASAHFGKSHLVVWDEYGGDVEAGGSFDVLGAFVTDGVASEAFVIAGGPAFQARPSVVHSDGAFWVAWEEGPDRWGGTYRSVDQRWTNATDHDGPLHSWRAVRLARIAPDGSVTELEVPMPSFERQKQATNRRPGAERVGVFYERPLLAASTDGGLWLAYRHVHQRQAAMHVPKLTTHVERGFALHVRAVRRGVFGTTMGIDERQRDGEQHAQFATVDGALGLVFETGRTDRRKDKQPRGTRAVKLPSDALVGPEPGAVARSSARARIAAPEPDGQRPARPTAQIGGGTHTLLFGDLHRHTDLSLCFPFFDGSIDDAYRYARGPGALDFVGLTDHARDLGKGGAEERPWELHVAAADHHNDPGHFVAFRSYERSQNHTDHNVVGLAPDADFLRPHRPPLEEFWAEFAGSEVITIPHATAARPGARFCGNVWQKRDDERRPVAELYQGFRDVSSMRELMENALGTGQKLGFIASSDHMATSSAYACVWSEGPAERALKRASIFEALRERRCYAATARIELDVTAAQEGGEPAWMGSEFSGTAPLDIAVRVRGTAPVERIEFWSQGELVHTEQGPLDVTANDAETRFTWIPKADIARQYLFVRVVQTDGEQAWSSPIFVAWDAVSSSGDGQSK